MADAPIQSPVPELQLNTSTINPNSASTENHSKQTNYQPNSAMSLNRQASNNKLSNLLNDKGEDVIMHDDSLDKGLRIIFYNVLTGR